MRRKRVRVPRFKKILGRRIEEGMYIEEYPSDLNQYLITSSQIKSIAEQITTDLRRRLVEVGVSNPLLLHHARIYEDAVNSLGGALESAQLPETLQNAAMRDLLTISYALGELFGGRIQIRLRDQQKGESTFEGYYKDPTGDTKRIKVDNKAYDSYSSRLNKMNRATTQIMVKEVKGVTKMGRAIAGKDGEWRCGLRYGGYFLDKWVVSIDAGVKTSDRVWRSVWPLSQAISDANLDALGGGKERSFTYHHRTPPMTSTTEDLFAVSKFTLFNRSLLGVINQLAR